MIIIVTKHGSINGASCCWSSIHYLNYKLRRSWRKKRRGRKKQKQREAEASSPAVHLHHHLLPSRTQDLTTSQPPHHEEHCYHSSLPEVPRSRRIREKKVLTLCSPEFWSVALDVSSASQLSKNNRCPPALLFNRNLPLELCHRCRPRHFVFYVFLWIQ